MFPSESGKTPLGRDNVWRRRIGPKLEAAGLGWVDFHVMRRTHSTLMNEIHDDPKLVADQLGHTRRCESKRLHASFCCKTEGRSGRTGECPSSDVRACDPCEGFWSILEQALKSGDAKSMKRWSGRRDSNPRRPAWEAGILPLNYSRRSNDLIIPSRSPCQAHHVSPIRCSFTKFVVPGRPIG